MKTGTQEKLRHLLAALENCLGEAAHSQVTALCGQVAMGTSRLPSGLRSKGHVGFSHHRGPLTSHYLNLIAVLLGMWHLVLAHLSGQHLPLPFPKQMTTQQGAGLMHLLIMLLPGVLSHPRPGGSPEPVASWPQLGLRPPQSLGLLCCFFALPRASATCQAAWPSGGGTLSVMARALPH